MFFINTFLTSMKGQRQRCCRRILIAAITACTLSLPARAEPIFPLIDEDVIVFAGGTEMVEIQKAGYLETVLTDAFARVSPTFRDLAWDADTVFFQGTVDCQWRNKGHFEDLGAFGDWETQLERVRATAIIVQYGAMESLAGAAGIEDFVESLNHVLDAFSKVTERIVLISPAPFEGALAKHNEDLQRYAVAVHQAAKRRGYTYVDLIENPIQKRTRNGWLTAPEHHLSLALRISDQLGIPRPDWSPLEPLRQAVVEKRRLWYDYWRPANWKCLFGDDGKRNFAKSSDGLPSFQEEWGIFPLLIAKAEKQVAAIASGNRDAQEWAPLAPKPRTGSAEADIAVETAAFTTPEGYAVNLFADETLGVANPLGMRWDPDGRLYVACTYVYPQIDPGARPDDTIVVLEDTDGDGRADKSTLFAEGLNIPTGIELGDGGVYVGQNTEILFLKDTDGDLKADERTVLLSGFGNGDSHQTINTFVWSPGGELFFCQGDGIESRVETPRGVSGLYGPGAFRFRPHRMELHGMLNNFMGPGNPWGVAFDDWGQAFVIDGAGGISHLTPAFLPVKRKLNLPRIGKPGGYCGIDVLASDVFPEDMRDDFVMGDYKKNQITRFSTVPEGAGFKIKFESPLLKSSHRNFRPVDVRVGPDGGVYVADFYNPVICHQDDFYRIPIRDKTHGRIWRLAPSSKEFTVPALTGQSNLSLLDNLRSPDRWIRYQTKRVLSLRDHQRVSAAAVKWAASQASEFSKLETLRLLETIERPNRSLLEELLLSEDARTRAYATRVLGRWGDRLDGSLALLRPRLQDSDVRVRMEAVLSAGFLRDPGTMHALVAVTDLPMDRWLEYAFKQAVEFLKPTWLARFENGEIDFENPNHLAAILNGSPVKSLIERDRALIRSDRFPLEERRKRVVSLIAQGESDDIAYAFHSDFIGAALPKVVVMTRDGVIDRNHPDDVEAWLKPLLTTDNSDIALAAIELTGLWGKDELLTDIVALSKNVGMSPVHLNAAIETLGFIGNDETSDYLRALAGSAVDIQLRIQIIASLCRLDIDGASAAAARMFAGGEQFDARALLAPFLKVESGPERLADVLGEVEIGSAQALRAIEALVALGSNNAFLRARFDAAADLTGIVPQFSRDYVTALAEEVADHGDAAAGEDVFRKVTMNCYACHQIHGAGGIIGPDLTAIGRAVTVERLIEEVIWPQRQIKEGYNVVQITHKNGEVITGYPDKNEDDTATFIRDPSTRKTRRIDQDDTEAKSELGSAMPAGLVASITRQQLRDLIRFLHELGSGEDRDDSELIRSWEVAVGDGWIPFQSRVSGELRASDLERYAKDSTVTLRPQSGEPARHKSALGIDYGVKGTLLLNLEKLSPDIKFYILKPR